MLVFTLVFALLCYKLSRQVRCKKNEVTNDLIWVDVRSLAGTLTNVLVQILSFKVIRMSGQQKSTMLIVSPILIYNIARFRHCQIFLLVLKLDGFFHIVFSVFWIVVMSQEGYQHGTPAAIAWYTLHFLLTALQFVIPFVARHAIRSEQPKWMNAFLVAHVLVVTDFVVVLQQSVGSWVFWVLAGKHCVVFVCGDHNYLFCTHVRNSSRNHD